MGCGISRFDHGLHRRSSSTKYIGDEDHSDINTITKDDSTRGSRLLFFAYHGEDDCRRGSISSPIHLKHITQTQSPVIHGNAGRREADNPDLERKSDTKLHINNPNIGEEEHDDDYNPKSSSCNNNGINGGATPLFMGSPSFREYCISSADGIDDDLKSSPINNIGNNNSKEREKTMRKEDGSRGSDEGCAGSSNSSSVTGSKKKRGIRRSKKGNASPNHRPGVVRRSLNLMNVASCYNPPRHHNHSALPPPPDTNCA